ncbi:MAG: succinate dehydrogenase [Candidatus Puniceispirillales bacterium]
MIEARLYLLQRLSAAIMAPLVVIHLLTIFYAIRGGLTAEEILARTQGFSLWTVFYAVFVLAVAIHAPLGLRKILIEWARLGRPMATKLAVGLGVVVLLLGMRAVLAVSGGL